MMQTNANHDTPNPYLHVAAADPPTSPRDVVEKLPTDECWRLLARAELGRLAVDGADGAPDVFPVNYLVHSGAVFIRSAPGSKLIDITAHPSVAFEVDGESAAVRWSVVIRGTAHRLGTDTEIEESGILQLASWNPTDKYNYIRITATTVTGRRFRRRLPDIDAPPVAPAVPDESSTDTHGASSNGAPDRRGRRPIPIVHFPPTSDD